MRESDLRPPARRIRGRGEQPRGRRKPGTSERLNRTRGVLPKIGCMRVTSGAPMPRSLPPKRSRCRTANPPGSGYSTVTVARSRAPANTVGYTLLTRRGACLILNTLSFRPATATVVTPAPGAHRCCAPAHSAVTVRPQLTGLPHRQAAPSPRGQDRPGVCLEGHPARRLRGGDKWGRSRAS
jgi:hypothetical protein